MTSAGAPRESCWTLVRDAARGDGRARSVFAQTYLPLIRTFFAQRWPHARHAGDVEDAIQETFVECFRTGGPLDRTEDAVRDFRAYLLGVVRNIARKFERERVRIPRADDVAAEAVESREEHLSRMFDGGWARTMMRLAGELMESRANVAGAAARLRIELLRLRFQRGMPIREIAAQWQMDADAVHRSYATARAEFHACLRAVVRDHAVRTEDDLDVECERILDMLG